MPNEMKVYVMAGIALLMVGIILYNVLTKEEEKSSLPIFEMPNEEKEPISEERSIIVDVQGAITNPGVYLLKEDARVYEVIEKAGGIIAEGDGSNLNQARRLVDGEMLVVPSKDDSIEKKDKDEPIDDSSPSKINLNHATSSELVTLPNIGSATANNIITYREENGFFSSIEDLLNVSGIGQATLDSIKDLAFV